MTQLETLNARYEKLQRLISAIEGARKRILTSEREELQKVLEKYFIAEDGDVVKCSHSGVRVLKEGANDYDSFIQINVNDAWDEDDRLEYTGFYINNYSFRTSEIAQWVVDIFQKQAHYTLIALDFQDDIIAEMNLITKEANRRLQEIGSPNREFKKECKEILEQIQAIEKEARFKALMTEEGLEIRGVEKTRYYGESTYIEYPDLQVRFDWTLRGIRGLRIDKVSASGKSADITVKVKRWDPISKEEVLTDEKIERVRMDNIESFLRYNSISI